MTTSIIFFFFNDTATTEIYTLSLHDALPISDLGHGQQSGRPHAADRVAERAGERRDRVGFEDRKSTRLNSSHSQISYAVFCLKKKVPRSRLVTSSTSPWRAAQPPHRPSFSIF